MQVRIDNLRAVVTKATPEEREWLDEYLSFEDSSKAFYRTKSGKAKYAGTKRVSLLGLDDAFPAGLVATVRKKALRNNILIEVIDTRSRPCEPLSWEEALGARELWLRDYQVEAVDIAIRSTRGILSLPTGAGKTEIAVGLGMRLGMTNTLFVAPEADLMHNAAKRWTKRTGLNAGRIGDNWCDPVNGFTAATFQTLASKSEQLSSYLRTVGCVIFDEVHTLPANSFYGVAMGIDAYWRIGISGTPLARGDKKSLYSLAATGSILYHIETQTLIDKGVISRPHIRMVPCQQEGDFESWPVAEDRLIVESAKRNALVVQLAQQAPKPCLVFVRKKKHGVELTQKLKRANVRAEFVWGEKNTAQRDRDIERLVRGELDVIVCSVVFQTGTDIPEVRSMVIACGGKSEIATLQRIGRGMRVVKDEITNAVIKDSFYVYDIMDTEPSARAGATGNRWSAAHSRQRFEAYTGVGHEVVIAT